MVLEGDSGMQIWQKGPVPFICPLRLPTQIFLTELSVSVSQKHASTTDFMY